MSVCSWCDGETILEMKRRKGKGKSLRGVEAKEGRKERVECV